MLKLQYMQSQAYKDYSETKRTHKLAKHIKKSQNNRNIKHNNSTKKCTRKTQR
jgi:hypothetical protein